VSSDSLHESLLSIYEQVIEEHHTASDYDWNSESREAAEFITRFARGAQQSHDQIHLALRQRKRFSRYQWWKRG